VPNVEYQIFISSTYDDLKDEREQVIKACLEMGHVPVGMEMFSAADEEQWRIITRQIDESDYYVVIVAQRYGSVVDGMSYTEKEYDYAIERGVPTLGFIINESAPWPNDRGEANDETRIKVAGFKDKIRKKPVDVWQSKDDLYAKCAIALVKAFNARPRPGWIRALDVPGPEVIAEIARLSSENAQLRQELAELQKTPDTSNLAQGEDIVQLTIKKEDSEQVISVSTTWNPLFLVVARTILTSPEERDIEQSIINSFSTDLGLKESYDALSYGLRDDDFEIIKTQLLALGLIVIDYVTHSDEYPVPGLGKRLGSSTLPIWKLTASGERLYASLTAVRRR
jgi:uncharacterized protein DUF4062